MKAPHLATDFSTVLQGIYAGALVCKLRIYRMIATSNILNEETTRKAYSTLLYLPRGNLSKEDASKLIDSLHLVFPNSERTFWSDHTGTRYCVVWARNKRLGSTLNSRRRQAMTTREKLPPLVCAEILNLPGRIIVAAVSILETLARFESSGSSEHRNAI